MGANDRIVQHLRLRAPSAQLAGRMVNRFEDALRCASLPDRGEKLLLVRRLDLGRLPPDLSATGLSLRIEQRVQDLGGRWVHGDDPSAPEADTVFFASRLQAAQAAVRRRARAQPLDAWYWRLALPGVVVDAPPGVFLQQVMDSLSRESAAPVTLPALVASLVAIGKAGWLIRHLDGASIERVLAVGGAHRFMPSPATQQERRAQARPFPPWRDALGQLHAMFGAADWPDWLPAVLRAAQWLPVAGLAPPRCAPARRSAVHSDAIATALDPMPGELSAQAQTQADAHHAQAVCRTDPAGSTDVAARPSGLRVAQALAGSATTDFDADLPTVAGGLLFVLQVLGRLGFAEWQLRHADAPLGAAVLQLALRRLRVPASDPAWALAASLPGPDTPQARIWSASAHWQDMNIALALPPVDMAGLWLTAVRRYLRRVARIGLASLCLRPARLRWSATHLDVRFALAAADMRVRRAALDLDPGWLDWLGRVVGFEYRQGPA